MDGALGLGRNQALGPSSTTSAASDNSDPAAHVLGATRSHHATVRSLRIVAVGAVSVVASMAGAVAANGGVLSAVRTRAVAGALTPTDHAIGLTAAAPGDQLTSFGPGRIRLPYSRIYAFTVSCSVLPCTIQLTQAPFGGKHRLWRLRDLHNAPIVMSSQPGPGSLFAVWWVRSDFDQALLGADVSRYGSVVLRVKAVLTDGHGSSITATRRITMLPPKPRPLPVLLAGSYRGIEPKNVYFSGDGGNIVTGIQWSNWSHTSATGTGTSDLLGCVPNCAQGTATPASTTVVFSDSRGGHFNSVVERRAGQTYTASYGTPGWPEGAG